MIDNVIILLSSFILIWLIFEKVASLKNEILKKSSILIISIFLVGWLDFYSLVLLSFYATFIFIAIKKRLKILDNILLFVVINILLLIFIKDYYLVFDISQIYIPLGVSYYFFRLISLVIEYQRDTKYYENISLLDYYTYVFFFPIFLAGPIQRFKDFYLVTKPIQNEKRISKYIYLFFIIIIKLLIIDIILYNISYIYLYKMMLSELNNNHISYIVYIYGLATFLYAYLDLMIYTEISKSIAVLLGFSTQENFNKPLLATNISQFWQSWHISLSNWTRDYVFFPTLIKTKKVWIATYASMFTIGIWHSISFNWIFWAFAHGTALNFYLWLRMTKGFNIIKSYSLGNSFLKFFGNIFTLLFVSSIFIVVSVHNDEIIIKLIDILI